MFIYRDILTLDNFLHVILGFLLMGVMWGITQDRSLNHFAMFAVIFLYARELTQVQARYHDNNFLKGWSLAGTDPHRAFHRHMEWIVPGIVINGVTRLFLM